MDTAQAAKLAAKRGSILKAKAKREAARVKAAGSDSHQNDESPKTRRDGPAPGTVGNGAAELARDTGMDRQRAQRADFIAILEIDENLKRTELDNAQAARLAAKRGSILKEKAKRKAEAARAKREAGDLIGQNDQSKLPRGIRGGALALSRETGMEVKKAQRLVKIGNKVEPELLDAVVPFHPRFNATTYQ